MKMHPNRQKCVQNLNIKQTWKQKTHAYLENDQGKYKKTMIQDRNKMKEKKRKLD